jgi:hypothetical protein
VEENEEWYTVVLAWQRMKSSGTSPAREEEKK